ncbi:hypothetical protein C8R43DRAFT_956456 [Mycena crocata]|nr:hypothetical protein C8R43DRAFT_956456 [Mycena crocata]
MKTLPLVVVGLSLRVVFILGAVMTAEVNFSNIPQGVYRIIYPAIDVGNQSAPPPSFLNVEQQITTTQPPDAILVTGNQTAGANGACKEFLITPTSGKKYHVRCVCNIKNPYTDNEIWMASCGVFVCMFPRGNTDYYSAYWGFYLPNALLDVVKFGW